MQRQRSQSIMVLAGALPLMLALARPALAQGAPTATGTIRAFPRNGAALVSWISVVNPGLGYNVYRREFGQTREGAVLANTQVIPATTTAVIDNGPDGKGLTNGKTLAYYVRAVYTGANNTMIEGPPSPDATVTPHAPIMGTMYAYDIGTQNPGGVSVEGNIATLRASGADVWNTADGQTFLAVPVAGDYMITVKLVENPKNETANGNLSAKVGLQIKNSLAAGDLYACLFASVQRDPEFLFEGRRVFGGGNNFSGGNYNFAEVQFPAWLRLVKKGSIISAFLSFDGTAFAPIFEPQDMGTDPGVTFAGITATAHQDGQYVIGRFDVTSIKIEAAPA